MPTIFEKTEKCIELQAKAKRIENQIKCVKKELDMRRRYYPYQVASGKKTKLTADYEIFCMEAVLDTLIIAQRQHLDKSWNQ